MEPWIRFSFYALWAAMVLVWVVGALFTKQTASRLPIRSRLVMFLPFLALLVLVKLHLVPHEELAGRLWQPWVELQLLGLALTTLGIGFAIWARLQLGSNWSGLPKIRQGHELVTSGPYALVRHPIYTGVLLAFGGSVVASGRTLWLLIWCLGVATLKIKSLMEERMLTAAFPGQYEAYRRRVKGLIPWVF